MNCVKFQLESNPFFIIDTATVIIFCKINILFINSYIDLIILDFIFESHIKSHSVSNKTLMESNPNLIIPPNPFPFFGSPT